MFEVLLTSIGLVLIIEGFLYFFLARKLKELLTRIISINPQIIKNVSALCVLIGLCLIYFTFKYYKN